MAYDIQRTNVNYETIARFPDYLNAQAVVDKLSDEGFNVATVKIVGEGLRSEEYVTGRLTTGRAALAGAGSGAWFGLFIGILFGIFAPAFGWLWIILWSVIIGAAFGAIFGAIAHAVTGGKRDFSSLKTMAARDYLVQVQAPRANDALAILNR